MPPPTGPTRNKLPMYLILAGAAGAGYYFYSSGAQRSATEHGAKGPLSSLPLLHVPATDNLSEEAHKLASNVDQASASAQHALNKAGATIDSTVQEGKTSPAFHPPSIC